MRRSSTQSFITELPLVVDSKTEKKLLAKFQAARQLYNACLHEAVIRMNLVKNSEAYVKAKKLALGKARTAAFSEARKAYRYSEYELHSLWSSFLARHVNQDKLLLHDAQIEYQRLESVLLEAWQQYGAYKSATQETFGSRFRVRGTAPHQQLASGVGNAYSLRSDSSVEQVSSKLENISQISQERTTS